MMLEPTPYCRAAVRAEVKRARENGRDPDRVRLRRETFLGWDEINLLISQVSQELNSAPDYGLAYRDRRGRGSVEAARQCRPPDERAQRPANLGAPLKPKVRER